MAKEDLTGAGKYNKQFPHKRAAPMWGGIGPGGFGLIIFHKYRKVDQWEWSGAMNNGKLKQACHATRPDRERGSWRIIGDNESFISAPKFRSAHFRGARGIVARPSSVS